MPPLYKSLTGTKQLMQEKEEWVSQEFFIYTIGIKYHL